MDYKKGRGAQINTHNRFTQNKYEVEDEYLEFLRLNDEDSSLEQKTKFIEVYPKSIVNKVASPDVGMAWSMNPYQGCEHGCTYCYARNSHEYWGYSAGSEFEQIILVKKNAPQLLEKHLQKKSWEAEPIMLSGNTDCYQPAEAKFGITRKLLEVLLKYKNPVGIITKNALIQRDLDILKELNNYGLLKVSLSITSLEEDLRRKLEPRTASVKRKLQTIELFAKHNIPVNVMMAPIIPGLNSHEILPLAKTVSDAGALSINYTTVRLNRQIGEIFLDWLDHNFPDRAQKVKHQIEELHGGNLNDSEYGRRMRGDGKIAEQIRSLFMLARKKYFKGKAMPEYNFEHFVRAPKGQMELF
ncbi:PA0069 family radical SAM protein [Owenweeksia hongkongensis]|uniref:PA0069 family radical SAM protein n=1 Tax=Owenweeksia hongkongensis TaxID=253245 RepID=UPI003A8D973A